MIEVDELKRPLVTAVLFYISGVLFGRFIINKAVAAALFVIILLTVSIYIFSKTKRMRIWIFTGLAVLGALNIRLAVTDVNDGIDKLAANNREVYVYGIIEDYRIEREKGYGYALLRATMFEAVEENDTLSDETLFEKTAVVRVYYSNPVELTAGMNAIFRGKLSPPDFQRNPGGFDEYTYMKSRGVSYKLNGTIEQIGAVESQPQYLLANFKHYLSDIFDKNMQDRESGIMKALVIGEKSALDNETTMLYRDSGISHILAISGLHISLLAMMLLFTLKKIGVNSRRASLAVIIMLIVYCFLVGASVSAVRATLMMSVVLFGTFAYRTYDPFSSVALSALAILIVQPLFLWDGGFLLSFGAVLGIILYTPVTDKLFSMFEGKLKNLLSVTLAVSLFTYPIVAYFFYTISTVSFFVNLLVIPLASVLVASGLLTAFLGIIAPPLSAIAAAVSATVLKFIEIAGTVATMSGFSKITTGRPPVWLIFMYFILLLIIRFYFYVKENEIIININKRTFDINSLKRLTVIYISANAAVLLVVALISVIGTKNAEVAFLDVGQGDCTVIVTPDNNTILIDGGGNIFRDAGDNVGTYVVAPYLSYKGIGKIDYVFLSHPDLDHSIGIMELFRYIDIGSIVISDCDYGDDPVIADIERLCGFYGTELLRISKGARIEFGDMSFDCVYPNKNDTASNINNTSMTLRMVYGDNSMLFTGDIEKEDEAKITSESVKNGSDKTGDRTVIRSDILKVPHHGSKTSSSEAFIESVLPALAIAGVSKNNPYGHPAKEVLERYIDMDIPVLTTAEEGAILITFSGAGITVDTMKNRSTLTR